VTLARRTFLKRTAAALAATALLPSVDLSAAEAAELDPVPFPLGVASGDPAHDSVVLWTRVARDPMVPGGGLPAVPVPVHWELARDEGFTKVLAAGDVIARPEDAHTVHVTVNDLAPDRWYWYRFSALDGTSRTGRTRTMPPLGLRADQFTFAFVSCQSWVGGRFAAYRDLAEHDLDLVVHLGDYIYETARGDLDEFRRLHALYKSSPDLRAAHARFPFVLTWDDHEVQNNYAADVAGGAGDGRPFLERRANGYQAYYEHLPLREAARPVGPDATMYRRVDIGRLAQLSVLDTRQYRSDQACGDGRKQPCADAFDPARTLTGPEQEQWLLSGLSTSKAVWNVLAQQTILAPFDYDLGPDTVVNLDQWDGYPAARRRILDHLVAADVRNPVVISGDWHTAWVNDVHADPADPASPVVATEFVGTSISSGASWDADVRQGLATNPHVRFYEGAYRGWTLCQLTPDSWRTTYRMVLDPRSGTSPAYTLGVFEVRDGVPGAVRVDVGDGVHASVRDAATAEPLENVELVFARQDGATVLRRATDPRGEVFAFLPPGDYTVQVNGVGYDSRALPLVVTEAPTRFATTLRRLTGPRARTGPALPGLLAEATDTDIVLENDVLALALSAGSQDSQLGAATVGKPRDLAAVGQLDQLDWLLLPYASSAQPRGGNAWQQRTVRSTTPQILSAGGDEAVIRVAGASTELTSVQVETTFALRQGQRWVDATSVFSNTGTTEVAFWVGDVIDHDGTGQRSGVAGHGTITAASPVDYTPTAPWIAMTGSDGQVYGLIYEDADFTAYAAGTWVMSQRQVTLQPGARLRLHRRVVAVSARGADPWSALDALV
jgi:phosphodiesterase/alkaline phosphatase D-like protein